MTETEKIETEIERETAKMRGLVARHNAMVQDFQRQEAEMARQIVECDGVIKYLKLKITPMDDTNKPAEEGTVAAPEQPATETPAEAKPEETAQAA